MKDFKSRKKFFRGEGIKYCKKKNYRKTWASVIHVSLQNEEIKSLIFFIQLHPIHLHIIQRTHGAIKPRAAAATKVPTARCWKHQKEMALAQWVDFCQVLLSLKAALFLPKSQGYL